MQSGLGDRIPGKQTALRHWEEIFRTSIASHGAYFRCKKAREEIVSLRIRGRLGLLEVGF